MSYSETEERIFRAAVDVFSMHGKEGARMQIIADAAGINKALVHYYFRSKDKLYDQAFDFIVKKYFSQLGDALQDQKDFASLLKALIDRYCDLLEANPMIYKFIFREVITGAPVLGSKFKLLLDELDNNPLETFTKKLKTAIRKKEIRPVDPLQTFITVIGSLVFYFLSFPLLSSLRPELLLRREQFAKERKKHVYELLYNGLKP